MTIRKGSRTKWELKDGNTVWLTPDTIVNIDKVFRALDDGYRRSKRKAWFRMTYNAIRKKTGLQYPQIRYVVLLLSLKKVDPYLRVHAIYMQIKSPHRQMMKVEILRPTVEVKK